MNNSSSRNAISSGASRVRRGFLVVGGAVVVGATLMLTAPAAYATHEQDCHKNGGSYGSTKPGDGHVYSSCTVGDKTIGWKDGKDPVVYPSPK
jgi:hypothetical protein